MLTVSQLIGGLRLKEPVSGVVWEFTRDPKTERRQLGEFNRLMWRLEQHVFDDTAAVDISAGVPWLGWWREKFARLKDTAAIDAA